MPTKDKKHLRIPVTNLQHALIGRMAAQRDMGIAEYIRSLVASDMRETKVAFPPMTGYGGDRISRDWRKESQILARVYIATLDQGDLKLKEPDESDAETIFALRVEAVMYHEDVDIYLLGDGWTYEQMEMVKTMIRHYPR